MLSRARHAGLASPRLAGWMHLAKGNSAAAAAAAAKLPPLLHSAPRLLSAGLDCAAVKVPEQVCLVLWMQSAHPTIPVCKVE
jgi:hypothetical protein